MVHLCDLTQENGKIERDQEAGDEHLKQVLVAAAPGAWRPRMDELKLRVCDEATLKTGVG